MASLPATRHEPICFLLFRRAFFDSGDKLLALRMRQSVPQCVDGCAFKALTDFQAFLHLWHWHVNNLLLDSSWLPTVEALLFALLNGGLAQISFNHACEMEEYWSRSLQFASDGGKHLGGKGGRTGESGESRAQRSGLQFCCDLRAWRRCFKKSKPCVAGHSKFGRMRV